MYKEAEALNFEKAAKLRDEISNLEKNELSVKWKLLNMLPLLLEGQKE